MNQQVIDYLRANKNQYTQKSLIAQLQKAGYQENDIKEGVAVVYETKDKMQIAYIFIAFFCGVIYFLSFDFSKELDIDISSSTVRIFKIFSILSCVIFGFAKPKKFLLWAVAFASGSSFALLGHLICLVSVNIDYSVWTIPTLIIFVPIFFVTNLLYTFVGVCMRWLIDKILHKISHGKVS